VISTRVLYQDLYQGIRPGTTKPLPDQAPVRVPAEYSSSFFAASLDIEEIDVELAWRRPTNGTTLRRVFLLLH
jgi:hypothetical protein